MHMTEQTGGGYMSSPVDHSEHVRLCMRLANQEDGGPSSSRYGRNRTMSMAVSRPLPPYANRSTNGFTGFGPFEPNKSRGIPSYCSMKDPYLDDYFSRKFTRMLSPNLPLRDFHSSSLDAQKLGLRSQTSRPKSAYLSNREETLYKVAVTTADIKGAGTTIPVFLSIRGDKNNLPRTRLKKIPSGKKKKSNKPEVKFTPGSTKVFPIRCPDLGEIESILIEHDGLEPKDSWLLQGIEIMNTNNKRIWLFTCNHWLSLYKEDGKLSRELFAFRSVRTKYEIVVVTGDVTDGGTDSRVFITLCGRTGVSPQIELLDEKKKSFQKGQSSKFIVPATCVGPISKIRIKQDESGKQPSWYLDRICVTDLKHPDWRYFFPCKNWLSSTKGDNAVVREIRGSKEITGIPTRTQYKISFYTGNKPGAGTKADIFIKLFGEYKTESETITIKNKDGIKEGSIFEHIAPMRQLGALEKIRVGHNNNSPQARWLLDKVIINDMELNRVFEFPCSQWFSDNDNEELVRDIKVKKIPIQDRKHKYEMKITTGNRSQAETTSKVYVIMDGPEPKDKLKQNPESSGKIWVQGALLERGRTDVCVMELGQIYSPILTLKAGISPSGKKQDWFLDDIVIFCPFTGIEQSFICGNWLSATREGCETEVTLVEDIGKRKTKAKKDNWRVMVTTGTMKHSGTSAKPMMVLYSKNAKSDDIAFPSDQKFDDDSTVEFNADIEPVGVPYKLRVQHDNSGSHPPWFLEKVVMLHVPSNDTYHFHCNRWLSDSQDDYSIVREMPAVGPGIAKPAELRKYRAQIYTGTKMYAGTDANVYINIFGEFGDTGDRYLKNSLTNSNKFEKGKMDEFILEAVQLGKIIKIRMGHDSTLAAAGWYVDKVIIWDENDTSNTQTFRCNCWFDSTEGDGLTVREFTGAAMLGKVSYEINVKTGTVSGAGTDANVFLRIYGKSGDTGKVQLKTSGTAKNKFESGSTDTFKIESEDIGEVTGIRLSHDNSGPSPAWFVDYVSVTVRKLGLKYMFYLNQWLDEKTLEMELDPSSIEKIEKTIPYQITVFTGDVADAGTDSQVFIQMYGKEKKTDKINLQSKSNVFQRNQEDVFKIYASDVGVIQKIRIGHDGKGPGAGWFLDKLMIEKLLQDEKPEKDDKEEKAKKSKKSKKQLNRSVSFDSSSDRSLDDDDSGSIVPKKSVSIRPGVTEDIETYWFFCNRWFAVDEDDGMIVRELLPMDEDGRPLSDLQEVEYTVEVKTGSKFGSGTDANVFLTVYGESSDSGERALKKTVDNKSNKFEQNNLDVFSLKALDLGLLKKIKILHDNSGGGASWYLDHVLIKDRYNEYLFPCFSWLSKKKGDGSIAKEIFPATPEVYKQWKNGQLTQDSYQIYQEDLLEKYNVKVYTSKKKFAGTDANVYIILFGDSNDSGNIPLKQSLTHSNKFESGNCDEFIVKSADLGELKKIKIGHDNSGGSADWHLEKVEIDAQKIGRSWVFPFNDWVSNKKGEGKLEVELYPQEGLTMIKRPKITYEVTTFTSNVSGAGTNANVYIQIYGRNDCTEQKVLANQIEKAKKYKKGAKDIFYVELEEVEDPIQKIRIGHDGTGIGAGWHLDKVLVKKVLSDHTKSITYQFPCNRWLAKDEDDHAIERELIADKIIRRGSVDERGQSKERIEENVSIFKMKKYSVQVFTGDHTGTNANVFIKIFGENNDSGERQLIDSKTHLDKFEKNNMDEFEIEAVDLGRLFRIDIRHDNSGFIKKDWFLQKVEIIDVYDNEKYVFHCERWLSTKKEDQKIKRTLYVVGYQGDKSSTPGSRTRSIHSGSVGSLDSSKDDSSSGVYKFEDDSNESLKGDLIPYTITVVTGSEPNMGSSGPIWVRFYGAKDLKTHKITLKMMSAHKFKPGSRETMSIEAIDVVDIKQIEVTNEGVDKDSSWYLNNMTVEMPTKGKSYNVQCGTWLSKFEGERKNSRTFNIVDRMLTKFVPKITYTITVITGDIENGGTSSSLFLQLFGTQGVSSLYPLEKMETNFERGSRDMFQIEMEDVGEIKKIRIQNEGKGHRPHWFLEQLTIVNEANYQQYEFSYNDYVSNSLGQNRKLIVDLAPDSDNKKSSYLIKVKTSDVKSAGTSSNVFIKLIGEFGDSGDLSLKNPKTADKPFQKNQMDEFLFSDLLSLGDLSRCQVWHDKSGFSPKWHLEYIEVKEVNSPNLWKFPCNKWLSLSDDDKQIYRELISEGGSTDARKRKPKESNYEITVITGDKKDAGMPYHVWFKFYGSANSSDVFFMKNKLSEKLFNRGSTDHMKLKCPYFIGDIYNIQFGAFIGKNTDSDNRRWYCHEIQIKDLFTLTSYVFEIRKWISIKDEVDEEAADMIEPSKVVEDPNKVKMEEIKKKGLVKYEVVVFTGDVFRAGTNANVFITLFGEFGDSGKRPLVQKGRDLFERRQEDKFTLECVDLGMINKIKIEHDNSGISPDWYLEKVQVSNLLSGKMWRFDCQQWLSNDKGDKNLWKILNAS